MLLSALASAQAQVPATLSLEQARSLARSASPELSAAREAVAAARGRELQAGAFPNPALAYSTERTSGGGGTNRQQIVGFEQPLELAGQRGARREAAELRRRAAQARLESAQAMLDFEVAKAYALTVAAERRAALARQAASAFAEAGRVSQQRLAAGDVSVYADRRLRLEAARYAALESESVLARRSARVALSALVAASTDSISAMSAVLSDSLPFLVPPMSLAILRTVALRARSDYKEVSLEAEASAAEARVVSRDRIPTPVISAGYKQEDAAGIVESLNGFAAGFSIPLPIWDRKKGAVAAADAEGRRAAAEREIVRRRVVQQVAEAHDALLAVEQQRAILAPQLGAQSAAALRSAQVAYAEGEVTLLEFLDAVRAYHEAESAYAALIGESLIRRAGLERVIGSPLSAIPSLPVAQSPGMPRTNDIRPEIDR